MHRLYLLLGTIVLAASATATYADVIITLEATDAMGSPIDGPVDSGTQVFVDIFASVDAEDNPLMDLRGMRLNFEKSNTSLAFDEDTYFEWMIDTPNGGTAYTEFNTFLRPETITALGQSQEGALLTLTADPVKVATVNFIVHASGSLNVGNHPVFESGDGAWFSFGFDDIQVRSNENDGIQGGTMFFEVPGTDPTDDDFANDNADDPDNGNENVNGGNDNAENENENENSANDNIANDNGSNDNAGNLNDNSIANDNGTDSNTNVNSDNLNDNGGIGGNDNGSVDDNENANDGPTDNDNGGGGQQNENGNDNAGGGGPRFGFCGTGMLTPGLLMLGWFGLCTWGARRRQ